jgi:hypothetical protein
MPGRGSLTFLIIGNVTVWIVRTALVKELSSSTQIEYYGTLTWLLLLNLNLPLLLFFRFHSSVCLADVWHTAYTSPVHNSVHGGDGDAATKHSTVNGSSSAARNGNGKTVEQLASSAGVSTLMRSYSLPQLAIAAKQQHYHGGTPSASNAAATSAAASVRNLPLIEGVEMIDDGDDGFTSLVDATIG